MKNSIYYLIALLSHCILGLSNANADASQSFPIAAQTGNFSVRFTAVPSDYNLDGAIGFGGNEISEFNDFNCIIRFGASGEIDVRNGNDYDADSLVNYIKGRRYYFQMDVNVPNSTYSVIVIPFEGDTVILAKDYAFRADKVTGSIAHFGTKLVGDDVTKFIGVADFQIGSEHIESAHDNFSIQTDALSGDFFLNVVATPSADSINGAIGLGKELLTGWGSLNCLVRFTNEGKIDVRNGSNYEAIADLSYLGGKPYLVFITGNTVSKTYSVKIGTPSGDTVTLAKDYEFRSNSPGDVLNYLSQRVVVDTTQLDPAQNGIIGSYIALDGLVTGELKYDGINPVISMPIDELSGAFSKSVVITPSADSINASYNLSKIAGQAGPDLNVIVLFDAEGKVEVRNDGDYMADAEFLYEGGVSYVVKIDGNTTTSMYSVSIQDSPYSQPVIIATDYTFRKNMPSETLNFAGTKTIWDTNQSGKVGSYLKIANVGITTLINDGPLVNLEPTISVLSDTSFFVDDSPAILEIVDIGDGNGGSQSLSVSAASSATDIATVSVNYTDGSTGELTITPVAVGVTTISVTVMDDGGVDNGGIDTKVVSFDVDIKAAIAIRDFTITVAEGEWGADNRILGGKDFYEAWLSQNTGEGKKGSDNNIVNIPPKFTYVMYLRYDLSKLPKVGGAIEASLSIYSETAKTNGVDSDSINVYVVEDKFFPSKDNQGHIDQELNEFYTEGDKGDILQGNNTDYIGEGYINWIVADNAPGFNEGNESDLSASWDYINHDVLLDVGSKFIFSAKDTLHTFSHSDFAKYINDDTNEAIVFVIQMEPNPNAKFPDQAQELYSGEDVGREPFISVKWDKNFVPTDPGCVGDDCEALSFIDDKNLLVYPNPTTGTLTFSDQSTIYSASIFTIDGKLVKNDLGDKESALNSIDVSALQEGLYFIKAYSQQGSLLFNSKFIKE